MPTHYRDTGGHRGKGKPVGGGGGKTPMGKNTGGAVGASNPGQAAVLNKHKTGQPVVPHNKAHTARRKK